MDFLEILSVIAIIFGLFTSIFYILLILFHKDPVYKLPKKLPTISIIIPFWNEGSNNGNRMRKTIDSVLAVDYPQNKLEIILVNDGSADNSLDIAKSYAQKNIKVLSNTISAGKTMAVNKGLQIAKGELVVGLDADSFINPDVLKKLVPTFQNPQVMAAVPAIKIWKPTSWLQHIQAYEFLTAVLIRHLQGKLGSIPLGPGAFTLIRKTFVRKHGLLNARTMVEDLEISLRIQSEGYYIEHVIDANVYTSGVKTIKAFVNQRLRWFTGFLIQLKRYKHLFSPKYGNLAFFVMPISVIYIFLHVALFGGGIILLAENIYEFIKEFILIGLNAPDFTYTFNPFFWNIDFKFIIPILLLIISATFLLYIKIESKETQPVIKSYVLFLLSYWLIGAICWILAIYYYIRKKKIRWGPNTFTQ